MGVTSSSVIKATFFYFFGFILFSASLQAQITDFVAIDFKKADSVAALYPHYSLRNLKTLSDNLTLPLSTEVEKFRAIYKWVCDNIENDYGLYKRNKYKRKKLDEHPEKLKEWRSKFSQQVFTKLLEKQRTVCTGYAYLVKELAYHAGLTCEIIHGYGRTAESQREGTKMANHSWNAIKLNSKWYLCDPTWSSGVVDPRETKFIKQFDNTYFLTLPSLFARNHYPIDSSWMLLKSRPTLSAFLSGPLVYKGAIKHEVLPTYPETFKVTVKKGEKLTFRFDNYKNSSIKNVKLQVSYSGEMATVYPEVSKSMASYAIDYVFSRKGTYVLHILLGEDYAFTYTAQII